MGRDGNKRIVMSDGEEEHEVEHFEAEDQIVGVPLTKDLLAKGLGRLERVGNGSDYAYVKFNGAQHELNDITALSDYAHLRYIYLSSNQLAELGPLSSIAQMLTLILDRNKIEQFNLPKMSYLQVIDLSYNKINTFDGLDHPLLKCLNLNYNKLINLDTMLMDTFTNLQVLELRSNQFSSLKGLVPLKSLKKLYLAQNRISDLNEFDHLGRATKVYRLSVFDNPCWEEDDLRIRLLIKMISLKVINKEEVTEDEQLEVKELLDAQNEDAAED